MKILNKLVAVIALITVTTACEKNLSSSTYTDSATAGIVLQGKVISARPVTVKSSDQLGKGNEVGMLGGGLAGGIGGSMIGKGKGSALSAVGGALAGGALGALAEDKLNTQQGMEYIVKLDPDSAAQYQSQKSVNVNHTSAGKADVQGKIVGSTQTNFKTDVISVVQGMDNPVQTGQKCYVIYNNDRPRVVAAF